METKQRVAIVGASGYTGVALIQIVAAHPFLELVHLAAGQSAADSVTISWPGLSGLCDLPIHTFDPNVLPGICDIAFLALPHGIAAKVAPQLVDAGVLVVDLGADFRFDDVAPYESYYGVNHPNPDRLSDAVYGLVEFHRQELVGARFIANPGCYPTAVSLAAKPLINAGWGGNWLVADCVSGVSGAGRKAGARNLFAEVGESVRPYGFGGVHRHVPEIEAELGCPVTFTPHLVPMIRGMVATVHTRPSSVPKMEEVEDLYRQQYKSAPMVEVRSDVPATTDVKGSNRAHVHVVVDSSRGVVSAVCVIDNLLKGASGQAVQALNVALGWDETLGLPMYPLLP